MGVTPGCNDERLHLAHTLSPLCIQTDGSGLVNKIVHTLPTLPKLMTRSPLVGQRGPQRAIIADRLTPSIGFE